MWRVVIACLLVVVPNPLCSAKDHLPQDRGELKQLFPVTIIHMNDLHARFAETSSKSSKCKKDDTCIAGVARIHATVTSLRAEYRDRTPLFLNAGDNYQGTMWYNYHRWKVVAKCMEFLRPDAMTLGNHEFDDGLDGLAPYLKHLRTKRIQTLAANLIDRSQRLPRLPRAMVIKRNNRSIGIIGVVYDKTNEVSKTESVVFSNSIATVRNVARKMKEKGVHIIIVLSHCGLEVDKQIAREAGDHVDVIVGGHSHSFLFSPSSGRTYNREDPILGDYPLVVQNANGRKILIAQAYAYGKYVGRLTTYFDAAGEIKYWEGYPIYLANNVTPSEDVVKALRPYRQQVELFGSTKIAETRIDLDQESCRVRECRLGSVFADAIADHFTNETFHPVALVHAGNFRTAIPKGDITNEDAIGASPFANSIDLLTLRGDALWNLVEHSVVWSAEKRTNVAQVSGLKIVANLDSARYKRVVSIQVQDLSTKEYKPLNRGAFYKVATIAFLASGKDGFKWALEATDRQIGPRDSDVFVKYLKKLKVITEANLPGGRFTITGTVRS
ncbi:apyrase-like [Anopheles cruzii]|uniref:apyrase-like n=1 Tax=Anopheles cruzii TaxID=68878 RepID=UPI0022EC685B|nr:apyrase-like [Anopheles cruzii]